MIPTEENVRTITDMRERALKLLQEVRSVRGPLYIFHRSKPKAVLLDIKEYQKLRDWIEDYFDSLKAKEYEKVNKKKIKWLSLDKLRKELGL